MTARESLGASSYNPLSLPLIAVAAGDALPEGTDAVVPLEHGQPDDRGRVVLVEVAAPGATMSTDTVPWPPPGGDLFFASIGHLDDGLKVALAASRPRAKHVLLDADSVNFVDTSACDAVLNTIKELQSQSVTFAFARVRDEVRERLRLGGIAAIVGSSNFYDRVTDGVLAWQEQERLAAASAGPRR